MITPILDQILSRHIFTVTLRNVGRSGKSIVRWDGTTGATGSPFPLPSNMGAAWIYEGRAPCLMLCVMGIVPCALIVCDTIEFKWEDTLLPH